MKAEKVLKAFYTQVQQEQKAFQPFVTGIPGELTREYVAVLLNRLMFLYFLQKRGFLAADYQYLRTKLTYFMAHVPERYFAAFLCPLFFEGFAKPPNQRSSALNQLFGDLPYFQETIFRKHQAETQFSQTLQIADVAFERLFTFFERYTWRLDAPLLGQETDLNPTLLGYLFEKQINQKEMGAYYTKEDITEYLSKNTIIPALLHGVQKRHPHFFESEQALWQLLRQNPPRYLYEAVKHGLALPLPEAIAKGLNDVKQRGAWQQTAPKMYALPTETWREVVARRQRATELLSKLANGEINQINDLVTYNLDIRQFAQDIIEKCAEPELLKALWQALQTLTVLDPACGSGAFLFAALTILEPLYTACLQRFEGFAPENPVFQTKAQSAYFLLKTIMLNNLYGVDLMPEALEICKLRLFLKLIAQLAEVAELDLLPNLDSNLRVGNSLVGFVQKEDAKNNPQALEMQQPFHWFREFPEVMQRGGFEVIIGNPPYVEYSKVKKAYQIEGYETEKCGNLYAFMMERALKLKTKHGWCGMIVPLSGHSTERMADLIKAFYAKANLLHLLNISADAHPSVLFPGVRFRLAIFLHANLSNPKRLFTTKYYRWYAAARASFFPTIEYTETKLRLNAVLPKIASPLHDEIMMKLTQSKGILDIHEGEYVVYYHNAPVNWIRAHSFVPYFQSERDGEKVSMQLKTLRFPTEAQALAASGVLCSSLFFLWWLTISDCYHLNKKEIDRFPIDLANLKLVAKLVPIAKSLNADLLAKSKRRVYVYATSGRVEYDEFYLKQSKPIIDELDKVLAQHYGFTPEELDFILNYDLKYRLGKENATKEEDEFG